MDGQNGNSDISNIVLGVEGQNGDSEISTIGLGMEGQNGHIEVFTCERMKGQKDKLQLAILDLTIQRRNIEGEMSPIDQRLGEQREEMRVEGQNDDC